MGSIPTQDNETLNIFIFISSRQVLSADPAVYKIQRDAKKYILFLITEIKR